MSRGVLDLLAWGARLAGPILHRLPPPPYRVPDRAFPRASRFLRDQVGEGGRLLIVGGIRDTDRIHFLPHFRTVVVDMIRAPGVVLRCDAHHLPFRDGSLDAAMAQGVLNHVEDAARVLREIRRVVRPGGALYTNTAFLLAHHPAPIDRSRLTREGWGRLLREWEVRELGASVGPFGAIYLLVQFICASAFADRHLAFAAWFLAGHALRPLLWLDRLTAPRAWAAKGAAAIYALAVKPPSS